MVKQTKKKQNGGDGYVINVNESIGGMPAHSRYSNNYRPIFAGELLQNGGDGYSVNIGQDIGGMLDYSRYTYNNEPVFSGDLTQQSNGQTNGQTNGQSNGQLMQQFNGQLGGGNCGCDKEDPSIFNLIKQSGGNKITQFNAIKEVSQLITPLSTTNLTKIISQIFLKYLSEVKPKKSKQFGGYINHLENILAPLGKNNLIVLAALLLLHHFAIESQKNNLTKKTKLSTGGDPFVSVLSDILAPIGINSLGTSAVLILIQQAFVKSSTNKKVLTGGNPLKNLISPLGTNAFIATGLLIVLERMITSKIGEIKKNNKLIGGKVNKKYEQLFNLLAPISFNTFAKESFLEKMAYGNGPRHSLKSTSGNGSSKK
jgi:hypothetical protein